MADEEIGGISVVLGASDAQLIGDLAEAEKLVQAWAKEATAQATISLRANFAGGATGGTGGGGADISQITRAFEQSVARISVPPTRQAQAVAPPTISVKKSAGLPGGGTTGQEGPEQSSYYKRINEQLAAGGTRINPRTGVEESIAPAQETRPPAEPRAARPVRQAEDETTAVAPAIAAPEIDVSGLQGGIKEVIAGLSELRRALTAATEGTRGVAPTQVAPNARPVPVAIKEVEAAAARPATATAASGRVSTAQPVVPAGDEEEGGGLGIQTRMSAYALAEGQRHDARVQQTRRTSGQRAFAQAEAQRKQELVAQGRQYSQLEKLADTYFSKQETRAGKLEDQASLEALSAQNQTGEAPSARTAQNRPSARGAPALTFSPAEKAARDARDQASADQANRLRPDEVAAREVGRGPRTARGTGGGTAPRRQTDADIERRTAQDLARSEARVTVASRTSRSEASGLGGFTLGGGRQRVEAEAALTEAKNKRVAAERDVADASAFANRPEIVKGTKEYTSATDDLAAARKRLVHREDEEAQALKKVQSFSGLAAGARNLAAVTVAGAAFGIGLSAISTAAKLAEGALAPVIDQMTGFGATSTRVTSALAEQNRAMQGHVDVVLATQEAQAGLSKTTGDYISQQLRLTTQVKSGALAQQQASDLFRAAAGTGQGTPQGLFGGFGGLGGSSLFAQQLGGGKGFSETVQGDLSALGSKPKGPDLVGLIGQGLSYATNPDVHEYVNKEAKNQGNKTFDVLGTIGEALGGLAGPGLGAIQNATKQPVGPEAYGTPGVATDPGINDTQSKYLASLTDLVKRGGGNAEFKYTADPEQRKAGAAAAALAGDLSGATAASQGFIVAVNGAAASASDYKKAYEQAAVAASKPSPDLLAAQFNQSDPAAVRALGRTQQYQLQTQFPAQAALQNLAAPPTPVGTGISANANEQQKVNDGLKQATVLQGQLNTYYAQGRSELENTYKPQIVQQFGAAAGQAFSQELSGIASLGKEIAGIQASISNEQAAYQTAQYNNQLFIARRTLGDIGGLTGRNFGAGQSYLGVLEKQNLALGRQGQMLQFALGQRQINFQRAVAGFEAPGLSPAEMAARQDEAKIETSYAQKQLDIQKQMFGNQVKIVDISNLRQGADLARQIGLLVRGRQVTIDVAVKQQELIRAQQRSEQLVKQAGTYLSAVDSIAATGISHIQDMETAAGRALTRAEVQSVKLISDFYGSMERVFAQAFGGATNTGASTPTSTRTDRNHATGYVGTTSGPTMTGVGVMGEAGAETYAILRNPRPLSSGATGGGTVTNIINVTGNSVRSDADIDTLTRKIAAALGRDAQSRGLRAIGNS